MKCVGMVCFVAVAGLGAVASAGDKIERLLSASFVTGEVVDVKPAGTAVEAKVKIVRIHWGPPSLLDANFSATSYAAAQPHYGSSSDSEIVPPLERGEKGIWLVARDEKDRIFPFVGRMWRMTWPVRQRHAEYPATQEFARFMERLQKVKKEDRPQVLREETGSKCDLVSACAIDLVSELDPKGSMEFLRLALQAGKLSVLAQTAADEALSEIDGKGWKGSKERGILLDRWVRVDLKASPSAQGAILRRVKGSGDSVIVRLLPLVVADPNVSLGTRESCCAYLGNIRTTESFEALLSIVRQAHPPSVRLSAASTISGFMPITEARAESLRAVLTDVKDPRLAEELKRAIAKYSPPDTAPSEPKK